MNFDLFVHNVNYRMNRTTDQDVKVNSHLFPKGITVQLNMFLKYHHPAYYKDPFVFSPEGLVFLAWRVLSIKG